MNQTDHDDDDDDDDELNKCVWLVTCQVDSKPFIICICMFDHRSAPIHGNVWRKPAQ